MATSGKQPNKRESKDTQPPIKVQSPFESRLSSTQNCAAAHFVTKPWPGDTTAPPQLDSFFSAIAPHEFLFR